VTFRVAAPKASEVILTGEFANGPQNMQKDAQGVWTLKLGPVEPDLYEYEISIDGVTSIDPRNPLVKYNRAPAVVSSLLDVPAAGPRFFDTKSVPHGKVDVRFYDSKATQSVRRVRIYGTQFKSPHPLRILLHFLWTVRKLPREYDLAGLRRGYTKRNSPIGMEFRRTDLRGSWWLLRCPSRRLGSPWSRRLWSASSLLLGRHRRCEPCDAAEKQDKVLLHFYSLHR
jgi:hypothetical protein